MIEHTHVTCMVHVRKNSPVSIIKLPDTGTHDIRIGDCDLLCDSMAAVVNLHLALGVYIEQQEALEREGREEAAREEREEVFASQETEARCPPRE